jgi:hypothetical protein
LTDGRPNSVDFSGKTISGFYVKYLLPLYIDINTITTARDAGV